MLFIISEPVYYQKILRNIEVSSAVRNVNDSRYGFNPITYGILPFRQLRGGGGGLFGPDPENKVTVNGLI